MTAFITRAQLRELENGASIAARIPESGLPLADFLRLDIPAGSRISVAVQSGVLPEPVICRWLGIVVRRALGRVAEPDPRSLAVLDALDRGEWPDAETKGAARAAARAASAHDADAAAAVYAAAVAGYRATEAATVYAAWTAAVAAAAAADPAYAAERDQQVADLLHLLEGSGS